MQCIKPSVGNYKVGLGKCISFRVPSSLAVEFEIICMTLNVHPAMVGRYIMDVFASSVIGEDGMLETVKDDIDDWRTNDDRRT